MARSHPAARSALFWALGVAAALRVLVAVTAFAVHGDLQVFHAPDTLEYVDAARSLLATGRFDRSDGLPEISRTPGYPVLLIPGLALGRLEPVTVGLQILIACLTVWLVYGIGRHLTDDPRAALIGAWLAALEPLSLFYPSKLLTETLFTMLTSLFLWLFLGFLRTGSWRRLLLSAAALTASVYVRPINYYLPLGIAGFWLFAMLIAGRMTRRAALAMAVFLLVTMGGTGLWRLRNQQRSDYGGFSVISDMSLYFFSGGAVVAAAEGRPVQEMIEELGWPSLANPLPLEAAYVQRHPEQRGWTRGARFRYMHDEGRRMVLAHPRRYAAMHLRGMLVLLIDPGVTEALKLFKLYPQRGGLLDRLTDTGLLQTILFLMRERPVVFWSNLLFAGMLGVYLLGAAIGLVVAGRASWTAWWVAVVAGYFWVLSGGAAAFSRFRHPMMPMLCALGGCGLLWLRQRLPRRTNARATQ